MDIELVKKQAWNRYRNFSITTNNLLKETNNNILGNIRYYQLEYERGRRIENATIESINKAYAEKFWDKPLKELEVADIACGLPFLEEILFKLYDITNFTLVDFFSDATMNEYLNILLAECPPPYH